MAQQGVKMNTWPAMGPRGFLLLLLAAHLAGIFYYLPPAELWGNPPLVRADYTTHFYQAATVSHYLRETGHAWGYDPHFMAGYPAGTVADLNNKGVEIGTWLLSHIVAIPLAFNLVILGLFVVFPLAIWGAGLLLGLDPWARAGAVCLTLILWYTEPTIHWAWAGGSFTFALASPLAVFTLAAGLRFLYTPQWRNWAILAAAAPLTILAAPQSLIALALPIMTGWLFSRPRRTDNLLMGGLGVALLVGMVNIFWWEPFFEFIEIKTQSDRFWQAGLLTLVGDLLGTGRLTNSPPCRCGLRWLMVGLTIYQWRSRRQECYYVPYFASGVVSLLALAYLGSYWQPLANLQPHRFVIPASLLATLPAADALASLAARPPRIRWQMAPIGLIIGLLILRTLQGAWFFRPALTQLGQPVQSDSDRLSGPPASYRTMMDWIAAHTTPAGRLLVNDWRLGALIPYYTRREVIGGPFLWMWIDHGYANAGIWDAFGRDLESYTKPALRQILRTYNIQWVITNAEFDPRWYTLDDIARTWPELLQPVAEVAGFRIYRTPWPANPFMVGSGQVSATHNRLSVWDASPDGIVLKYHWLPTLQTDPPLPLRPYPVLDDPVGFIQVDNGTTRTFTIYNGY